MYHVPNHRIFKSEHYNQYSLFQVDSAGKIIGIPVLRDTFHSAEELIFTLKTLLKQCEEQETVPSIDRNGSITEVSDGLAAV